MGVSSQFGKYIPIQILIFVDSDLFNDLPFDIAESCGSQLHIKGHFESADEGIRDISDLGLLA